MRVLLWCCEVFLGVMLPLPGSLRCPDALPARSRSGARPCAPASPASGGSVQARPERRGGRRNPSGSCPVSDAAAIRPRDGGPQGPSSGGSSPGRSAATQASPQQGSEPLPAGSCPWPARPKRSWPCRGSCAASAVTGAAAAWERCGPCGNAAAPWAPAACIANSATARTAITLASFCQIDAGPVLTANRFMPQERRPGRVVPPRSKAGAAAVRCAFPARGPVPSPFRNLAVAASRRINLLDNCQVRVAPCTHGLVDDLAIAALMPVQRRMN